MLQPTPCWTPWHDRVLGSERWAASGRPAVDRLVESGELVPTTIEGWSRPAFLYRDATRPRVIRSRAAPPEAAFELAEELRDLAGWLGLGDIRTEPRGELAPLSLELARGGSPRVQNQVSGVAKGYSSGFPMRHATKHDSRIRC